MIKNVQVIPGCISCRNCEMVCPKIFKVNPTSKVISHNYEWNESEILQAEAMCPVNVIKVDKKWDLKLTFKHARVKEKNMLNRDVLEVTFETDNFSCKPGQYISLQASDLVWKFSRSYSIATSTQNSFTLNVKLLHKGRGSNFLKKLKNGDNIRFLWPLGNFYLKDTKNKKVFIATGTGLAPMIAMLEACPKEIEKVVLFWVRYEEDIYYKEKLEQYKNTKVIIKVSKPSKSYAWDVWRVTDSLNMIGKDDEVYICWNPEMVQSVQTKLSEMWHNKNFIFNESFTISRVYPGFWKDMIFDGNIPAINIVSWFVIIFSLTLIPFSWFYNSLHDNLYGSYLWINNFMWFLYDLSWWTAAFVMMIRPLSDLFPKLWILRKLTNLRKAFWILSASIIVVNVTWPMILDALQNDLLRVQNYFTSSKWSFSSPISIAYGVSELTALLLLLTSNYFSQKKLWIWWKRLQRSSYLYFISGWIASAVYFPMKVYPVLIVWWVVWILAYLRTKLWK